MTEVPAGTGRYRLLRKRLLRRGAALSTPKAGAASAGDDFAARSEFYLDRLGKALTIAEAVDQVVQDKQPNQEAYRMLCGALETLQKSDPVLIVPAFMLKLLAHEGVAPVLDECVIGGEATDLEFFDPRVGGVTCAAHQRGRRVSSSALELMRATLGGALATVLEVQQAPHTDEVSTIAHRLWEFHIERRLRSTELLS